MKKDKMTKSPLMIGLFLASMGLAFQACTGNSDQSRTENAIEQTGDAVEAETRERVDQTADDFERERDRAVVNLEEERTELDQEIDELKTKIDRKTDKASADLKRQLAKLENEHRDLDIDIDKAKKATKDVWQDIKAGFKKAGRTIGNSFEEGGEQLETDRKN